MTAVVEVYERYAQKFQQFANSIPKNAIKLTFIKSNLDEEIEKRINEIKNGSVETHTLNRFSLEKVFFKKDKTQNEIEKRLYAIDNGEEVLTPYAKGMDEIRNRLQSK